MRTRNLIAEFGVAWNLAAKRTDFQGIYDSLDPHGLIQDLSKNGRMEEWDK